MPVSRRCQATGFAKPPAGQGAGSVVQLVDRATFDFAHFRVA